MVVKVNNIDFIVNDDKIEIGDLFVDVKEKVSYIHMLIEDDDYDTQDFYWKEKDIDVIVFKEREYNWNKELTIYKKIK